ncbi:MAG: 3-deoxy-D-manno-octulosonic-acid transferase [Psychrosphaera sp.]|jgi:3-deoxy-D-manno-octulosonic-acid transferase
MIYKIKRTFSLFIYNLLLVIFTCVDLVKWVFALFRQALFFALGKSLTGAEKRDWAWGQKYGLVARELFSPTTQINSVDVKTVMFHCASVGEVVAVIPLIKHLLRSSLHCDMNLQFVITTNTKTGKEQLLRLLDDSLLDKVKHCYLPIDLPWLMSSLLKQVNPDIMLIMEVELWPNLINQCHKKQIPVCIVNARLTDKTRKGYQKVGVLAEAMIKQLQRVYARNQTDFDNYIAMGIDNNKLTLLGNIKFDIGQADLVAAEQLRASLNLTHRQVIIAGSSHEGEESLLVDAYKQFKTQNPHLILIICPRHPQRFETVFDYLNSQQLNVVKMSESTTSNADTDVLLGDQMGQLSKLYGVCDIAFVCGSFVKRGGHNPIEAAAYAKPIIMGPHVYNNPEICHTLQSDGGLFIANSNFEFISQINTWLSAPESMQDAGNKALSTLTANAGIIEIISSELLQMLDKSTP